MSPHTKIGFFMPNSKNKPNKAQRANPNAAMIKTVEDLGIMRKAMAERTGIEYKRMNRIFYGARVFVDEAFSISNFLRVPVNELFPHVVQPQSN